MVFPFKFHVGNLKGHLVLLQGTLIICLLTGSVADAKERVANEQPQMTKMRAEARQRTRRIIYNDDGCGPIWAATGGNTPEGFLSGPHSRMKAVLGTQVDSVFINSGATHVLNHTSTVAESYADVSERYGITAGGFDHFRDNMRALEALGTDAVRLTVDFCRSHGVEAIYSYRVNDLHLAQGGGLNVERSTWWRQHPEYWLGTLAGISEQDMGNYPATDPRHWGWASLNFELPQVRAYLLSILEEVANRYDLDGMEIDFLRAPILFLPNLDRKPATDEQRDILTGFLRQVRQITVRAAAKRGRPMLVGVRIPAKISQCYHVGIDIDRWLDEDLTDLLSLGGGYVPLTNDWNEMVNLGHRHGVPVYPVISNSGLRGPYNTSIEAWRAAAMNAWRAGADGIYLFNHFPNEPSLQFQQLGDPRALARMDKVFTVENDVAGYKSHYICLMDSSADKDDPQRYGADIGTLPKSRLLPMTVDTEQLLILPIGDDIVSAAENQTQSSAVMKVHFSDSAALSDLEVMLNGRPLTPTQQEDQNGWFSFTPKSSWYKVGPNKVSFRPTKPRAEGRAPVRVLAVEVHVKYP